ncbi:MAG TPA: AAA family ATPase [Gammaproteobacteria bacterium]|nr:AAA family ATPase [Gammaproteobacteria bacterium]
MKPDIRFINRWMGTDIEDILKTFPCVLINGPRQAGKTTLAKHLHWGKGQIDYVNFDDVATIAIASQSPQSFLSGFAGPVILQPFNGQ